MRQYCVQQAKRTLVQDHIDNSLEATLGQAEEQQQNSIDEFKVIVRYLLRGTFSAGHSQAAVKGFSYSPMEETKA